MILNRQKSTTILRTDTQEVKSTIVLEKLDCLLYIKKQKYILNRNLCKEEVIFIYFEYNILAWKELRKGPA